MPRLRTALALFATAVAAVASLAGCGSSPLQSSDARSCTQDVTSVDDLHVIQFAAVPDLSPAFAMKDWDARGRYVVGRLRETADRSQAAALAMVRDAGICIHRTTVNWISNTMLLAGPASLASRIATLPGVQAVVTEDVPAFDRTRYANAARPTAPTWGLSQLQVPGVWASGVTGRGVTIGLIDTGVDWQHPALRARFRGATTDGQPVFDYNWWSPLDRFADAPVSLAPHGTHVAGTAVGGTGSPGGAPVGVAPGATFISALACTATGCPLAGVLSGLQFMIAPTNRRGGDADPAQRPHIVANSWQRAAEEVPLERAVAALEAAGVLPVFAVGNDGPACGTARTPGARDDLLLSVGATDRVARVAGFSGRGPAPGGGPDPDVVAPGVDVVSSAPGRRYATASGTSMAAPAVAGVAALVMQANPALRGHLREVVTIIRRSAHPVGGSECGQTAAGRRNNVSGYGRVDAARAVRIARAAR